jgi:hypothetical protein
MSVVLITMFCGILGAWGFIEPYFESYIREHAVWVNSVLIQIGPNLIFMTFPLSTCTQSYLVNLIGYKQSVRVCLLGFAVGFLCFYGMHLIYLYYLGFVIVGLSFTMLMS